MDVILITRRTETIPGMYEPFHPPLPNFFFPSSSHHQIYISLHKAAGPSSRPTVPTPSSERERDTEDLGNFISSLRKVDAEDLGPDQIDRECRICFELYRKCAGRAAAASDAGGLYTSISGEDPVRLPCNHIFGRQCLEHWLRRHDQCPKCRRELLPPIIDPDEVMPDMVFSRVSDEDQEIGEESEWDEYEEPALGLLEASNILRLLTNIVLEGRYTLENSRYLLHLIGDVQHLVEMNQLVPGTVDDLRALYEKFNQVIATGVEWIRDE